MILGNIMLNSINLFHTERKIATAFDDTFYVKSGRKWNEIKNVDVYKGFDEPTNDFGSKGDYYIQYHELKNNLIYSEDFTNEGWIVKNSIFSKDSRVFPKSYCSKMIPTQTFGEHSIAYQFSNPIDGNIDYWCFSIYVLPNEYNYFQLILSDSSETQGLKATFSVILNSNKKIVVNKRLEKFGDITDEDIVYSDDCYGIENVGSGVYRIFLSAKFLKLSFLQCKFKILKNLHGEVVSEFANENDTAGLFINAAQLSENMKPIEYVFSNGAPFSYYVFKKLFKKDSIWKGLEYASAYYGDDYPKSSIGIEGDIYFVNPFITFNKAVRFGKNTLYKCWGNDSVKYFTETIEPNVGDNVYSYTDKITKVGTVSNYNYLNHTITVNGNVLNRKSVLDFRINMEPGVFFWNVDKDTYGYVSEDGKIYNLSFNGKSLYNFDLINQAITYSVNLFNQTYTARQSQVPSQYQIGFNTGGHGNFWDYNRLRRFY